MISVSRLYCRCVSISQGGMRALSSEDDILQGFQVERAGGIASLRKLEDVKR